MRARTINYLSGAVIAFGGFEYVDGEWRDVPPGFENAAERHPYLETKAEVKPKPAAVVAEPAKPKPKPATRRTRRKSAPKGTK